jgi:hypothetical protein
MPFCCPPSIGFGPICSLARSWPRLTHRHSDRGGAARLSRRGLEGNLLKTVRVESQVRSGWHTGLIVEDSGIGDFERAAGSMHGYVGLNVESCGTLGRHINREVFALLQVSSRVVLVSRIHTFLKYGSKPCQPQPGFPSACQAS